MKVLSLFSGIGGFDLGFAMAGYEFVGQVEIEPYCLKILEHHFPDAKRWTDIRNVSGADILRECGPIDVICGGFPCQDISSAGKGAGLDAERSGLWFEMLRLIREIGPRWVVAENVAALRARGLERVVSGMEDLDYQVRTFGIRAGAIGAGHKRDRLWIVANDLRIRERGPLGQGKRRLRTGDRRNNETLSQSPWTDDDGLEGSREASSGCELANANSKRVQDGDLAVLDQEEIPPLATTVHLTSRQDQEPSKSIGKSRERLNPRWVLQLMGYPSNWLSVPSVMLSYPPSRMESRRLSKELKIGGLKE